MARSPFSLYKRKTACASRRSYYVQFRHPQTHEYLAGRSVGRLVEMLDLDPDEYPSTSKAAARLVAALWLKEHGAIEKHCEPTLGDYCLAFWDWGSSDYIRDCKLRNKHIGREYVDTCHSYISRFLKPHELGNSALGAITAGMLESFILGNKSTYSLSNKTCNGILGAITKPLNEAARIGIIKESPSSKVRRLSANTRRKGILSSKEIRALFSTPWDDERVRIATLLSLTCGLRLGEILAIQRESIHEGTLEVRSSFSKVEGMKSTKNTHVRVVPLDENIQNLLLALVARNPFKENWVFWCSVAGKPMSEHVVAKIFIAQLEKIGIKDTPKRKTGEYEPGSRQARNISFHSLRHLYNTLLRGAIPDKLLRESTGHLTESMTDHYDHPEHDLRLKETALAVETRIMPLIQAKSLTGL